MVKAVYNLKRSVIYKFQQNLHFYSASKSPLDVITPMIQTCILDIKVLQLANETANETHKTMTRHTHVSQRSRDYKESHNYRKAPSSTIYELKIV